MKVWNPDRIRKQREGRLRREAEAAERTMKSTERERTYASGNVSKNAALMLDALGSPVRRKLIFRLKKEGAMSVSKLVQPFRIKLPLATMHVQILERSAIISTHKRGRVRMCVYNPRAFKELGSWLIS